MDDQTKRDVVTSLQGTTLRLRRQCDPWFPVAIFFFVTTALLFGAYMLRPSKVVTRDVVKFEKAPVEISFGDGRYIKGPADTVFDLAGDFGSVTERGETMRRSDRASAVGPTISAEGPATSFLQNFKFKPTELSLGDDGMTGLQSGWNYTIDILSENSTTVGWIIGSIFLALAALVYFITKRLLWSAILAIIGILCISMAVAFNQNKWMAGAIVLVCVAGIVLLVFELAKSKQKDDALGPIQAGISKLPGVLRKFVWDVITDEAQFSGASKAVEAQISSQRNAYGGPVSPTDITSDAIAAAKDLLRDAGIPLQPPAQSHPPFIIVSGSDTPKVITPTQPTQG